MRIILTGGGTGGHLFPIIAVARELKTVFQQNISRFPSSQTGELKLIFIGPPTIGEESLAAEGISHKTIFAGKLRRYASLQNVFDIFKIPLGFIQSLWHLFAFMPNVVFSKGGYGSIPVILAARVYRIPVLIHESDTIPGLANKFCARFSKRIAIAFAETSSYFPPKKTALTGNPVRVEILKGSKEEAKRIFGLSGTKPVLLILGGSQGAQAINDAVFMALVHLLERCEIIHQCGAENFESLKQLMVGKTYPGYFLFPFLDEQQLNHAYAAADLIISRAGAGSIAEIATLGKPSIIVPLPDSASNHQLKNATEFGRSGATLIIEQMNLTPHLLQNSVFSLLDDPELLKKMSENSLKFAQPQAAQKIAEEVLNIAKY